MKNAAAYLRFKSSAFFRSILLVAAVLAGTVFFACSVSADTGPATSTDYQLSESKFNNNLGKSDIGGFSSGFAAVPGMEETAVRELSDAGEWKTEACHCMVPQGLCVTDDYIVISAYCDITDYMKDLKAHKTASDENIQRLEALADEKEHGEHGSVLYVLDRESGQYLTTISLFTHKTYTEETAQDEDGLLSNKDSYSPLVNHVGGITFDGNYIWIARSSSQKLSRLSISAVDAAVNSGKDAVAMSCDKVFGISTLASFIDYYDGCLWTSISNPSGNGVIIPYDISDADNVSTLTAGSNTITISAKGNGAKFFEQDGRVCLAVNCSYGRGKDYSHMFLYEVQNIGTNPVTTPHGKLKIPSMAEEIEIADGKLYTVYESASPRYNSVDGHAVETVIDRLVFGDCTDYFTWLKYNDFADEDTSSEDGAQLTRSVVSSSYLDLSESYAEVTSAGTGCTYSDRFFLSDAVRTDGMADPDFAKTGANLAAAAYNIDQSVSLMKSMGFSKINAYNYHREASYSDNDFVAFTIGRKIVRMEGEDYCIYVVAVRGTPATAEWYSNFNLGETNERNHAGFYAAESEVKGALISDFLNSDGFDAAHRKILISGHSRGAAVSNILAGQISESGSGYFNRNNVFGYTYACPAVSYDANTSYANIFNFNYAGDIVASLPLSSWGYLRYGQDVDLDANGLSGQNFRARFQQKHGSEFAGASSVSSYVNVIEEVIGNTSAAPKTTQAKEIFSALAWLMGGRNSVSWREMVKALGSITSASIGSQMDKSQISLFNYADLQETYIDELQVLKSDLQQAVITTAEMSESKFKSWLQQNYELIRRAVDNLDGISQITTKEELQSACNAAVVQSGMDGTLTRSVKLAYDLYRLFIDSGNSVLDAVAQGHACDNYALNINSRYFGYYGWTQSSRASELSLALSGSTIGTSCFSGAALTGAVIRDTVRYISKSAFSNCQDMTSLQLPADAEYNGNPFSGTEGITTLHYTAGKTGILPDMPEESLKNTAYSQNTPQFTSRNSLTEVILDEGITKIGAMQFALTKALERIETPSTVKEIGHHAFTKCRQLADVEIPSEIESIGEYAFAFTKLGSLEIGSSLREIPQGCFYSTALKRIEIPETLYTIGEAAFTGTLEEVVLPADIDLYAEQTSGYSHDDVDDIYIDRDGDSFQGTIKKLTLTKGKTGTVEHPDLFVRVYDLVLEEGISVIPESTFRYSALKSVVLPASVKHIPRYAFLSSDDLTSINLDHVESIGESAFLDCAELTDVTCGNALKVIGDRAFHGCSKLTAFEFGDAMESVGEYAFARCALEEFDYNGEVIDSSAFDYNENLRKIRIGDRAETDFSFNLQSMPLLEEAYFGRKINSSISISNCPALRTLVCSGYYAKPYLSGSNAPLDQLIVYIQSPDLWFFVSDEGGVIDGYRALPLNVIELGTDEGGHGGSEFWDNIPVKAGRMNYLPVRIRTEAAEDSIYRIEDGPIDGLTFNLSEADSEQTYIDRETGRFYVGEDEENSFCISIKYKDLTKATVWVIPEETDEPGQGIIPEVTAVISGETLYYAGDTMRLTMILKDPNGNKISDLSGYEFQWYRCGENGQKTAIAGADAPEYTAEVTGDSFGEYCCVVQYQGVRAAARWITITEKDPFESLYLIPEKNSVLTGDTVKLRLEFRDYDGNVIDPPGQYRYVWKMTSDETNISFAETDQPYVAFTADEDTFNYYYYCVLYPQGSDEPAYYSYGLVRLYDLATAARLNVTHDDYITIGKTVRVRAEVRDDSWDLVEDISPFTIAWEKDGQLIEGENSFVYEFTAQKDSFTNYTCRLYYNGQEISTETFYIQEHVHSDTEVWNDVSPSCTEEGYSGDVYCRDCNELVEKGTVIPAKGHTEVVLEEIPPTCTDPGYTQGVYCYDCGEVLQEREEIPPSGHEPGEPGVREPTCSSPGYEGIVYCTRCGEVLERGTETEPDPDKHVNVSLCNHINATYTSEGYSGDLCCEDCGKTLEYGHVIPKLEKDDSGGTEDTGSQGGRQPVKPAAQPAKTPAAAETPAPPVGSSWSVSGQNYKVLSNSAAAFTNAPDQKSVVVPDMVKIKGRTYQITQINEKAFRGSRIRTVTIGKNVTAVKAGAFTGSKVKTVILKTKKLTKKAVKGSLKNSRVKKVQVKVGSKKINKRFVKKYKKIFAKKNSGRKVAVK